MLSNAHITDVNETNLRQVIESSMQVPVVFLPSESEIKTGQAIELIEAGDFQAALPLLREAHQAESNNSEITLLLAQTLMEVKLSEEAEKVLKSVPIQDQDTRYHLSLIHI